MSWFEIGQNISWSISLSSLGSNPVSFIISYSHCSKRPICVLLVLVYIKLTLRSIGFSEYEESALPPSIVVGDIKNTAKINIIVRNGNPSLK